MRKHIYKFRPVLLFIDYRAYTNIDNRPVLLVEYAGR